MKTKENIIKKRIHLKGISSSDWEHPTDSASLKALKKIKYLDQLMQFLLGGTTEKSIYLATLASAVKVSKFQFPKIYKLHIEACKILDIDTPPSLFVSQNPFLNAGAIGVKSHFIVLNSSIIDVLTEDELIAIIGHELAHIKSGHVLYKTLLYVLLNLSFLAVHIPLGGFAIMTLIASLREWDRKSELSSDRAGLLTCQDPEVAINLLMKLSGGNHLDKMNSKKFIEQAQEYNNSSSLFDTTHKVINSIFRSHPFPVVRVMELKKWVDSGEYQKILNKNYQSKTAGDKNIFDDIKQATQNYKEDFEQITKPIEEFAEKLKNIFNK